ncbi:UNVERIFIED_CONTAM: hypothetical protein FKN15_009718 [Acipenser sinensis]
MDSYGRKNDGTLSPCLWVGTSLGVVLVISLNLPSGEEQRQSEPVMVAPSGTVLMLKGAVLTFSSVDCAGGLIHPPYEVWRDPNSMDDNEKSRKRKLVTFSPSSSQDMGDYHFAVICSEKQAKVYSLPSQNCLYAHSITESSFVLRADVVTVCNSVCLACFCANGHIMTLSLPSLRPMLDVNYLPLTDMRIARTFCFTNGGQALFLSSPTEVQRITFSQEMCENLQDMLGELFTPVETPEAQNRGFLKGLFGGSGQTFDREELFGEAAAGKASRSLAQHIPGPGSMEGMKAAAGGVAGDLARARIALDERGQRLGELEDRTAAMMGSAESFSKHAHEDCDKIITSENKMHIDRTTKIHSGHYTCIYSVEYDGKEYNISKTINLIVKDFKEYDAYVTYDKASSTSSCAEEERTFVLEVLSKVLEEQLGYQLCIYEQDVLPGGAYTEDIVSSIKRSRRVIYVLSPRYISSPCIFELQTGINHLLVDDQFKLILIKFRPLPEMDTLPHVVKRALKILPAMKWNGSKSNHSDSTFWKNVRYYMPVYIKTHGEHVGFRIFMDALLLSLTRKVKLPDVEFFVNLGDWPLVKRKPTEKLHPILSWCGSNETRDIVMPTYDLTESVLETMGRQFKMFVVIQNEYKYQINIDGTVAAYRLPYLLAGDSVVLKQDSIYYEHFYNDLKPWEHYVPFKRDLSDLLEKIQWVKNHDEEAKKIAKAGQEFARNSLMGDTIFCYYVKLFQEYANLLVGEPKIREGMELVEQPKDDLFPCTCHRKEVVVQFNDNPLNRLPDNRLKQFAKVMNHIHFMFYNRAPSGRSMGARAAAAVVKQLTEDNDDDDIQGLICLSYPLHPPKQQKKLRTSDLQLVQNPVLFLSGIADEMCEKSLLEGEVSKMVAPTKVYWIDGANHGMGVKGRTEEEIMDEMNSQVLSWIQETV